MKFYYLREFKNENGFDRLTVIDRLILSAILTKRLNNDERDFVEIIMNFDYSQDYTTYSNWVNYKDFSQAITNFLNTEKGYISDYVLKNYKERSKLHYISFDYNDLDITHKNAMTTIACKAFILGAANHSVNDNNDWFSFNLCQWSKSTMTHKKRSLTEIDNFMNKHNILYEVKGNKITVLSKKKQKEVEKELKATPVSKPKEETADEYNKILDNIKEDEEANRAIELDKKVEEQPKKSEYDKILQEENIFNLIESHLTREMIAVYNAIHPDTYNPVIDQKYKAQYLKYQKAITLTMEVPDVAEVIYGKFIQGADGLSRKNTALCTIYNAQKKIIASLDKLYSKDKECYVEILKRLRNHKLITFDTGIKE